MTKHGTYSGYTRGCRCDDCKSGAREYNRERRKNIKPLEPDDPKHGTSTGYMTYKCRCDRCKKAHSDYLKARKKRPLDPDDPRHGSFNAYTNLGCRCDPCKKAASDHIRDRDWGRIGSLAKYGLTPETWEDLFNSQGRKCASCGDPEPEEGQTRFHVDHDHDTGETRKILCHGCNVALGLLKDDIRRIYALADYLAEYKPY